ncbi:phage tail sheath C-terminal domain-containing protein [Kitasatospora sp. NPDC036755]|uniref:phage tail sheath family protein n=1 Tax=Kitasatospora sp. NPDC036755 TaxID=3154600 RepID=UPI0033FC6C74
MSYVDEQSTGGLWVSSGDTAVPVFLGDFGRAFEGVVRVDSLLHFLQTAGGGVLAAAAGGVVRGYFDNGGGFCYLADTSGRSVREALAGVGAFGDVTVLVPVGLWDRGADAAGEQARAVAAYAAGRRAMAIFHAGRDHDAHEARDAALAFGLTADQRAHAVLYHPWLVPSGDQSQPVPPVGAVAGVWSAVDRDRGVWVAPADVGIRAARAARKVTEQELGGAQPVNFLHETGGRGTVVTGARTLDDTGGTWAQIPVRRLADTVGRDLQNALSMAVFETNTQPTWTRVQAAADTYLHGLWRRGALAGSTSAEAFSVRVGKGVTMTDQDVEAGRIILTVGFAPVRPAEFVTVTVTAMTAEV